MLTPSEVIIAAPQITKSSDATYDLMGTGMVELHPMGGSSAPETGGAADAVIQAPPLLSSDVPTPSSGDPK